jgi:hypothetical protein
MALHAMQYRERADLHVLLSLRATRRSCNAEHRNRRPIATDANNLGKEMSTTTLNAIREHDPCTDGWKKLLARLGKTKADDEPLSLLTILDSNGLDDALWCLRAMPKHDKHWRLYAVWCARQVQHLMTDARSVTALDVAERHAHGKATDAELAAARAAAWDAAMDAAKRAQAARLREVCAQIDAEATA